MKIFKLADMKGGWFVGDFEPAAYATNKFELAIKHHHKNEDWPRHYQKEATEINLLISGLMVIKVDAEGTTLIRPGDIFVIEPGEAAKPFFLEDSVVVCAKTPSLPNDKVISE